MSSWSSEDEARSPSSSVLRQFSLAEIRKATNNFDQAQLLRRGWSIDVYKGTYDDYDGTGKIVVIKCLNFETTSRKSFLWFGKEVEAWSQYRHKHVVPVIGYCSEGGAKIVVYEYMQNGSLANHLCTNITPASFCLSSEQCLQICIDAARGLEYMHTRIRYPSGGSYFLGDVRLSNILLDGNGVAKVSDLFYEPFTRDHESAFVFDPEYHSTCIRERSSDVYAFGMLLVKVLARKVSFDNEDMNLGKLFKKSINNGTIHQIIHPVIKEHVSPDCLEALIQR